MSRKLTMSRLVLKRLPRVNGQIFNGTYFRLIAIFSVTFYDRKPSPFSDYKGLVSISKELKAWPIYFFIFSFAYRRATPLIYSGQHQ